jgi:hypothetical protein
VAFESLWQESQTALYRLSAAALTHCANAGGDEHISERVPIFMIHAMYQAACVAMLLARNQPGRRQAQDLQTYKNVLRLIDSRWQLAGRSFPSYAAALPY